MLTICTLCRFAEFGSSAAVLNAQYNLDSLMLRYQGMNWRDEETWKCNAQLDPQQHDLYDGTSLNPLEVYCFGGLPYCSAFEEPHIMPSGCCLLEGILHLPGSGKSGLNV